MPIGTLRKIEPRVDMIATLGNYLELKKEGSVYKAKCPFHSERTPSFTAFPDSQRYHCFGCGRSGTIKYFLESLGINLKLVPLANNTKKSTKKKLPEISLDIVTYWHNCLPLEKREYFYKRGFTDNVIENEMWGWQPKLERYAIPIWDDLPQKSKVIGVKLRSSKPEQKLRYFGIEGCNDPQLYNKHLLHSESKSVLIVFGEFDAKSVELMGQVAVSPTAGANGFKKEWVRLFKDFKKIYVCPDNGSIEEVKAAASVVCLFDQRAKILRWPSDVKDANEYYLKYKNLEKFWEKNNVRQ